MFRSVSVQFFLAGCLHLPGLLAVRGICPAVSICSVLSCSRAWLLHRGFLRWLSVGFCHQKHYWGLGRREWGRWSDLTSPALTVSPAVGAVSSTRGSQNGFSILCVNMALSSSNMTGPLSLRCRHLSLLTHSSLSHSGQAWYLPWTVFGPEPISSHLARLLRWGAPALWLWGEEVGEASMSVGVCVIGGVSQTTYERVWDEGPPVPRGSQVCHPHRTPNILWDPASSGKCDKGHGTLESVSTIFWTICDTQHVPTHPLLAPFQDRHSLLSHIPRVIQCTLWTPTVPCWLSWKTPQSSHLGWRPLSSHPASPLKEKHFFHELKRF